VKSEPGAFPYARRGPGVAGEDYQATVQCAAGKCWISAKVALANFNNNGRGCPALTVAQTNDKVMKQPLYERTLVNWLF
jgi:hypothetical protein